MNIIGLTLAVVMGYMFGKADGIREFTNGFKRGWNDEPEAKKDN